MWKPETLQVQPLGRAIRLGDNNNIPGKLSLGRVVSLSADGRRLAVLAAAGHAEGEKDASGAIYVYAWNDAYNGEWTNTTLQWELEQRLVVHDSNIENMSRQELESMFEKVLSV